MSFSLTNDIITDVFGHTKMWISPIGADKPAEVFSFDDPDVCVDYHGWSPDGERVSFDHLKEQEGDIWLLENFE